MGFGVVVAVDDDLGDAVAVAEVDEDQAALIAAAVDPAVEDDGGAGVSAPQRAAGMGATGPGGYGQRGHGNLRGDERASCRLIGDTAAGTRLGIQ